VVPASEAYDQLAADISAKIKKLTGADVPIVRDADFDLCGDQRLDEDLIVLGNRSTNRVVSDLYDLYYCYAIPVKAAAWCAAFTIPLPTGTT